MNISNRILRGFTYCAVDVLGRTAVEEMLLSNTSLSSLLSGPTLDISGLEKILRNVLKEYQPVVAQGFSQRMGMVFFHYLRRTYPDEVLDNSLESKLKPFKDRIESALEMFFKWLKTELKFIFFVSRQGTAWKIQLEFPALSQDHGLASYFFKGILLELFDWIDCHYRYGIDAADAKQDELFVIRFFVSYSPLD